jgi:hypothetical protein
MAGHSRSKNGVASLAYVPGIHTFLTCPKDVEDPVKPGHEEERTGFPLCAGTNGRLLPSPSRKRVPPM